MCIQDCFLGVERSATKPRRGIGRGGEKRDPGGRAPFRLAIALLHAEALDFEGARKCCEETLDLTVEENRNNYFVGRNL